MGVPRPHLRSCALALAALLPRTALALDKSVPYIHGDVSRSLLGDGTGVVVGIIDSGVDSTHPALTGLTSQGLPRLKAQANFVSYEPANSGDDVFGHGTAVASVIASSDLVYTGMAPDVQYVNARVLDSSNSFQTEAQVMNGIGYAISQGSDVLNLSLSYFAPNAFGNSTLDLMLDWATYERGVSVVTIAGNISQGNGYQQVRSPGSLYNGMSVGRTTIGFAKVSTDSASATTQDGRSKPDLVAPGTLLTLANANWEGANPDWTSGLNGTSFAAPHVTGLIAQQIDYGRAHALSTDPMVIKATEMNSAVKVLEKSGAAWQSRASANQGGVLSVTGPLDVDSGAGQIDGVRLYTQYSAGKFSPGSVPTTGWDLNAVTGVSSLDYNFSDEMLAGTDFTATLTWLRHVTRTDNGDGIIGAGDSFSVAEPLDNLSLQLLLNGQLVAESVSTLDNLQNFDLAIPTTGIYTLRVSRNFVSGTGNDENYAVAWMNTVPEPASVGLITLPIAFLLRRRRV